MNKSSIELTVSIFIIKQTKKLIYKLEFRKSNLNILFDLFDAGDGRRSRNVRRSGRRNDRPVQVHLVLAASDVDPEVVPDNATILLINIVCDRH